MKQSWASHLKRLLNKETIENTDSNEQLETVAADVNLSAELSAMSASLVEKTSLLEAALAEVTELKSIAEQAVAKLEEVEQAYTSLQEQVTAGKELARKEKLKALVGDAKLEETFTATKALDDTAFEVVCQAFAISFKNESESPLFNVVGAEPEQDTSGVSKEMQLILAANKQK